MRKIAGIDLSLTSPSVCVFEGDQFNINACKFYFLTDKKKLAKQYSDSVVGSLFDPYQTQEERYHNISGWILSILHCYSVEQVFIEDYAFAATGRVFHIAENGGVLKYRMWLANFNFVAVPPTQIKKFATGRGNATKEDLQVAFIEETGYNPKKQLELTDKQWNPSSDIIDSYYICKYGFNLAVV